MKLTLFNRKKYFESLQKLKVRKAPSYIIEAYKDGYASVVNEYYRTKLDKRINKSVFEEDKYPVESLIEVSKGLDIGFLNEALTVKDLEFIKAFFKMANLDLVSGDRLPPNASKLIRQKIAKDFGLKDLYKKLT